MSPPRAQLPMFPLEPFAAEPAVIERVLRATNFDALSSEMIDDLVIWRRGSFRLDINTTTGEVWMADEKRLWKPDFMQPPWEIRIPLTPEQKLLQAGLGPFDASDVGFATRSVQALPLPTRAEHRQYQRDIALLDPPTRVWLDQHVSFSTELEITDPWTNAPRWVPLVGRGVRRGITYGAPGGAEIGLHGAVPRLRKPAKVPYFDAISVEDSTAEYRAAQEGNGWYLHIDSSLAYEMFPAHDGPYLRPVWIHRGWQLSGLFRIKELPIVAMPATTGGPELLLVAPPPVIVGSNPGSPFAAGAWWIEPDCDRHMDSKSNAEGFLRGMQNGLQWRIAANTGNPGNKTDWTQGAANGIEQTDLAYYVGHADKDGWELSRACGTVKLSADDVGPKDTGVLWGRHIDWIAICACGPLQDSSIDPIKGGKAAKRWAPAFDGLHTLLGFATPIGARTSLGGLFAKYLKSETVIDAWFRAARETHANPVSVAQAGVLYGFAGVDKNPLKDRLNPRQVAERSNDPDNFCAIWTPA